jgi:hypothetical protein
MKFSAKLAENVKDLLTRIDKNKASLIIIDGGVGEGKTTLGVEIADYANELKGLHLINLDYKHHPQLALGGEEFTQGLRTCYQFKLPAIVYDEAGDFSKRGSLTRFNSMLNRTFETFRGFRILVILCLPSFNSLDNDLFDKNIPRLLLHLQNRTENQGDIYGFSLYRMLYIKNKYMPKLTVKSFAYQLVNPNFFGHFQNLEPERARALDYISTRGKLSVLKKAQIKIQGLVSYMDIAKQVQRSVVWVKKKTSELKIKHKRIIDRCKYFDQSVIDRLSDEIET